MRRGMIVLLAFILVTASCAEAHTAPRQPVPLTRLQTAEATFDPLARGLVESWNSRDVQMVKDLFAGEAEARDRTFGDHAVGPDQIAGLISVVSSFGSSWEALQMERYVGLEDGLAVEELSHLKFGSLQFTQDHPMLEVDWLQTGGGLILNWTIFYALDTMQELGVVTSPRLVQARSLLAAYESAWSSGDEQAVAHLYARESIREDLVFMEQQEGQKAIASFARSFFAWYPGVQWHLSLGFGEGLGEEPITGGLYVITVSDPTGQPCEVKAALLLQASENLITHERLYYAPQSLIRCGWAK